MELVFTGIHGIWKGSIRFWDKWWKGVVQEWVSFEVVGTGGAGISFFVRTPTLLRSVVESKIYAQYPDAEIFEAEDYTGFLPLGVPDKDFDLWGTEMLLTKEDAYPIRTYLFFEEMVEERRLDPLANLTEVLSQLKEGEHIWIQFVARPIGSEKWVEEGNKLVDELIGRKKAKKESIWSMAAIFDGIWYWVKNFVFAPFTLPSWWEEGGEKKDEGPPTQIQFLSPGEQDAVKAIQANLAKAAYEVGVRWMYVSRRAVFSRANISGIFGVFRQFSTENLNGFKPDGNFITIVAKWKLFFAKRREYVRKRRLFRRYLGRIFPVHPFVFNVEELATVYHYPIVSVEAPMLRRVEARKGEPPVSLPTL